MKKAKKIRRVFKGTGIILFGIVFSIYFSYHLLNGKRGVFAYQELSKEVAMLKTVAYETETKKLAVANKIERLSADNLDLDLLDESARVVLSMSLEGEYVVYY